MMAKIKDAEHSQSIAEMRQKIAQLEIEVCRNGAGLKRGSCGSGKEKQRFTT